MEKSTKLKAKSCIFCGIIIEGTKQKILYKDDSVYIIEDIKPVSKAHLLVNPIKHIVSINYLTKDDKELIQHMIKVASDYVTQNYSSQEVM
jgi:histidine triad (HIT) family protein